MRSALLPVVLASLFTVSQTGCGTLVNLHAPPEKTAYRAYGPSGCEPFGGVERSSVCASLCLFPPLTPIGAILWVTEVPLSFVGDTVTYPIATARKRKLTWATWWGAQARPEETPPSTPQPPPATSVPIGSPLVLPGSTVTPDPLP